MKIGIIIISLSFGVSFFCGCETMKTKYISTDSLNVNYENDTESVVVKITGLILKNGTSIDLEDKEPQVDMNKESKVISYDKNEKERNAIPFKSISLVKIQIVKSKNPGPFAFLLIFIAVGIIALLLSLHHMTE